MGTKRPKKKLPKSPRSPTGTSTSSRVKFNGRHLRTFPTLSAPTRDRARRPAHARDANGFDGGYRKNRARRRVGTGPRAARRERPSRRSARFAPLLEEGRLGASSRRDASRLGRHRREVLATGPTRGGAEGRPRRCRPQHIVPGAQEEAGQGAEEGEHPLEPPPPVCSNLPSRCPLPSSRAFTRSTVPVALTR